ncbi:MAG TPA: thymidine phosphorylase [Thermoanaerobaculia bacterium]|nr:thymidine phosphorylase [Thermoanaerobaculia bacterium]
MGKLSVYEVLNRKRRGDALANADIEAFVDGFTKGEIPDYQMSALLMAIAIRGTTNEEMATLTQSMLRSGEQWALRDQYDFLADKHSTGGVGDKVSLVLAPWVAACGVKIGMLSGRGLGHTGGTLDKLEAIPGFNARLSRSELERCLEKAGCVISTSTSGIAPADRKMYALRDVTGTVESLPLITASIMSKKLAMGASALILDVKTGSGAFMREYEQSRALAKSLIAAAEGSGTVVEAFITDMDRPLGVAAGNANEIIETINTLRGEGPADLEEVTRAQAVRVLVMSGKFDEQAATALLNKTLHNGAALEQCRIWIEAQGGDPSIVDNPDQLPSSANVIEIRSPQSGYITMMDTYALGMLAVDLGAGRKKQDDEIDYPAGILFDRRTGEAIKAGEVIARVQLGKRQFDSSELSARYFSAVTLGDAPPAPRPAIHELITASESDR